MTRNLIIILLLILSVPSASAAIPLGGLDKTNPHNMSSGADSLPGSVKAATPALGGTDQICIFCHTPHSAAPKSTLWSRPNPKGPSGDGTFPLYGDVSLAIKIDDTKTGYSTSNPEGYPNGASRMCLSCHDGTTSIGVLLDRTIVMEAGSETVTNNNILGGIVDLSSSHPISFNYNADVVTTVLNPSKPDSYRLPDGSVDTPLDGSGRMQCTTCHDPHEDTRGDANYGNLPFWRHQGGVASYDDVCESCHWNTVLGTPVPVTPPHVP